LVGAGTEWFRQGHQGEEPIASGRQQFCIRVHRPISRLDRDLFVKLTYSSALIGSHGDHRGVAVFAGRIKTVNGSSEVAHKLGGLGQPFRR
jgi:hypothetical protein